jgi:hypothetical protein
MHILLGLQIDQYRMTLVFSKGTEVICIIIIILDIIYFPVFYLKHNISETGFCFRLQVVPSQLGPIDRANTCLSQSIEQN